jgi:methionyl-tRNA formyltransferase
MMKVLVLGRNEILHATVDRIVKKTDHEVVGIITAISAPEYKKKEEDFKKLAQFCGAKFHLTQQIDNTAIGIAQDTKADIVVSINWPGIVQDKFINIFKYGVLNAHFGDLPRYRGNAVTNWAILAGETQVVLTIHKMEGEKLDSGDILLQKHYPLTGDTTIDDINRFAEDNIPKMFCAVIDGFECGRMKPTPQSATGLTPFRCYPRIPRDGKIKWSLPAEKIHALVRSLTKPYSGAYIYFRSDDGELKKLYIWKTRIVSENSNDVGVPGHIIKNDTETGESWVFTGEGVIALINVSNGEHSEIFMPGKKWKSIRFRLDIDLHEELFQLYIRTKIE